VAPIVENKAAVSHDVVSQIMRDAGPKKGFDLFLVTANVQAYQAKFLEMAQANMQLAVEFAQRLAIIRSPFEIASVLAEFTSRRIDMFRKHAQEIAELSNVPAR